MNGKAVLKKDETSEDQTRYAAHFKYDDLVKRLLDVKQQRKEIVSTDNSRIERESSIGYNHKKPIACKMTKKQKLLKAISDKEINKAEIVLPKIRTPNVRVEEVRLNQSGNLESALKISLNLKLQPINKTKNSKFLLSHRE